MRRSRIFRARIGRLVLVPKYADFVGIACEWDTNFFKCTFLSDATAIGGGGKELNLEETKGTKKGDKSILYEKQKYQKRGKLRKWS